MSNCRKESEAALQIYEHTFKSHSSSMVKNLKLNLKLICMNLEAPFSQITSQKIHTGK